MNKADKIKNIRQLVDRYYDGMATPDEVGAITDFFRQCDIDALPEDLRADAMIFTEIAVTKATEPVPDGLESRLDSFIDTLPVREVSRSRGVILRLSLSAAAAVAVVVCVGLALIGPKPNRHGFDMPGNTLVAEVTQLPAPVDTATAVEVLTLPEVRQDEAVNRPRTPVKKHRAAKAVKASEFAEHAETDEYHYAMASAVCEISDPEEASRVAAQVFGMLGRTLGMAGDAVAKSENEANKIPQTFNKIKSNEK